MSCNQSCSQGRECDCGAPVDITILAILFGLMWFFLGLVGLFHVVRWVL